MKHSQWYDFQGHLRSGSRSGDDLSPLSGLFFIVDFSNQWSLLLLIIIYSLANVVMAKYYSVQQGTCLKRITGNTTLWQYCITGKCILLVHRSLSVSALVKPFKLTKVTCQFRSLTEIFLWAKAKKMNALKENTKSHFMPQTKNCLSRLLVCSRMFGMAFKITTLTR